MFLLAKSGAIIAEGEVRMVFATWGDPNPSIDVCITHVVKRPLKIDLPKSCFCQGLDESEFLAGTFVTWEALLCTKCHRMMRCGGNRYVHGG